MLSIEFLKMDGKFVGIECDGHCEYAEEGADIVCAAASSIVQTAVLGLMQVIGLNIGYQVDDERGYLKAILPKDISQSDLHDADIILKTAYVGVSDLYENYSDFISLEVK